MNLEKGDENKLHRWRKDRKDACAAEKKYESMSHIWKRGT